jgi:chromosome partitioning protein
VSDLQKRGATFIVIDTPPHSAPAINAALEVSTVAVMVTRPNPMDIRALEATWDIVRRMQKPAATIFTQTPPGNRARALTLAQGRLKELDIPTCPTPLSYTLSFPYAQAEALAVQEREPTSKARAEIAEVWSWMKRKGLF